MKKYFLTPVLIVILGLTLAGEVFAISGFMPNQIWYSKEKLIEGETVDVHTSVWNGEGDPVLVKVDFYDFDNLLGYKETVIKPQELKDIHITWKVVSGEHLISAKIVSSVVVIGEDKKNVSLRYTKTDTDKQDVEKEKKIEKIDDEKKPLDSFLIEDILPEKITATINESYNSVDDFRSRTSVKLTEEKDKSKKTIDNINKTPQSKNSELKANSLESITKKPFAYVKLFVLSVLAFIFEYKIIFYGLIALTTFYIIKAIFRSFKHK